MGNETKDADEVSRTDGAKGADTRHRAPDTRHRPGRARPVAQTVHTYEEVGGLARCTWSDQTGAIHTTTGARGSLVLQALKALKEAQEGKVEAE